MKIFGIETSCDETAASIVEDGHRDVCSVVASSREFHEKTGGIVPEIAARKQVEFIVPVIEQCLTKYIQVEGFNSREDAIASIDAIAITYGPGLIGSLLVGVEAAKALALTWNKPLIPVNHLVGHIYANWIGVHPAEGSPKFPLVALVVSGGHTDLVLMRGHNDMVFLGGTLDDAAGEAFDKTARLLGIANYLGGYLLSRKAGECQNNVVQGRLPRPMLDKPGYDFSFSGLKTAVKRLVEKENPPVDSVACEFETAVVDVLVGKALKALEEYKVNTLLLGGGVSANVPLRLRLGIECKHRNIQLFAPLGNLSMDTAIYIAGAAYFTRENAVQVDALDTVKANPSLSIMD